MKILTATESFYVNPRRLVEKGQPVSSDDPIVKGREHLFTELVVEQATAAPGEKRATTIPKKRTTKKARKPVSKKG